MCVCICFNKNESFDPEWLRARACVYRYNVIRAEGWGLEGIEGWQSSTTSIRARIHKHPAFSSLRRALHPRLFDNIPFYTSHPLPYSNISLFVRVWVIPSSACSINLVYRLYDIFPRLYSPITLRGVQSRRIIQHPMYIYVTPIISPRCVCACALALVKMNTDEINILWSLGKVARGWHA